MKVNTDGAFKGSGTAGCGGVFRNSRGLFLGAFASPVAFASSIAAEILAVIEAIQLAWVREWHHLWIETDSTLVVHFLSPLPTMVPWLLRTAWANCLLLLEKMDWRVSHIYREGNSLADSFANYGANNIEKEWWSDLPAFAAEKFQRDASRLPYFRQEN